MAIGGVVIQFAADTRDAVKEIRKLTGATDDVGSKSQKVGKALKVGLAAGATAVAGAAAAGAAALFDFTKMAVADDAAQRRLANTLKNTTQATDKQIAATEEWIDEQGRLLGVSDDELRPGLARLANVTGDVDEAMKLAALAMDISAYSGEDLEGAIDAVTDAARGNVDALEEQGITVGEQTQNAADLVGANEKLASAIDDAAYAQKKYGSDSKEFLAAQEKVKEAQRVVNGLNKDGVDLWGEIGAAVKDSAETQAGTVEGAMNRVVEAFDEAKIAVGEALLPKLQELADWLSSPEGVQAMEDFAEASGDAAAALADIAGRIKDLGEAWGRLPKFLRDASNIFGIVGKTREAVSGLTGAIQDDLGDRDKKFLSPESDANTFLKRDGGVTNITVNTTGATTERAIGIALRAERAALG